MQVTHDLNAHLIEGSGCTHSAVTGDGVLAMMARSSDGDDRCESIRDTEPPDSEAKALAERDRYNSEFPKAIQVRRLLVGNLSWVTRTLANNQARLA